MVVVMPVRPVVAWACGLTKVIRHPEPAWYWSCASGWLLRVSGSVESAEAAVRMRDRRQPWSGSRTLLLGSLLDERTSE